MRMLLRVLAKLLLVAIGDDEMVLVASGDDEMVPVSDRVALVVRDDRQILVNVKVCRDLQQRSHEAQT